MSFKDLMDKAFIFDDSMGWTNLGSGVERKIMAYHDNLMLVKVKFDKDAIGAIHHHPHLQMTYIAKGSFRVTIDNSDKILNQGDVFFADSNIEHGVVCLKDGILIDVFNPCREDFL